MAEYRKQRYDAYIRERQALDTSLLAMSERYGKALLALSGGSLALSVTFLEKIAPHPLGLSVIFLIVSWALLLVSIIAELLAMHASQKAIIAGQEFNHAAYEAYLHSLSVEPSTTAIVAPSEDPILLWNNRALRYGLVALGALILGLIFLCVFSITNIRSAAPGSEKAKMTNEKSR